MADKPPQFGTINAFHTIADKQGGSTVNHGVVVPKAAAQLHAQFHPPDEMAISAACPVFTFRTQDGYHGRPDRALAKDNAELFGNIDAASKAFNDYELCTRLVFGDEDTGNSPDIGQFLKSVSDERDCCNWRRPPRMAARVVAEIYGGLVEIAKYMASDCDKPEHCQEHGSDSAADAGDHSRVYSEEIQEEIAEMLAKLLYAAGEYALVFERFCGKDWSDSFPKYLARLPYIQTAENAILKKLGKPSEGEVMPMAEVPSCYSMYDCRDTTVVLADGSVQRGVLGCLGMRPISYAWPMLRVVGGDWRETWATSTAVEKMLYLGVDPVTAPEVVAEAQAKYHAGITGFVDGVKKKTAKRLVDAENFGKIVAESESESSREKSRMSACKQLDERAVCLIEECAKEYSKKAGVAEKFFMRKSGVIYGARPKNARRHEHTSKPRIDIFCAETDAV